jgi:hypothetical protein
MEILNGKLYEREDFWLPPLSTSSGCTVTLHETTTNVKNNDLPAAKSVPPSM